MNKRLFVDMDGVIANFQDSIIDEDGSFQIELMYQPDFFKELEPFHNIIEGIKLMMLDNPTLEVYIMSAAEPGEPPYFVSQKNQWLDRYLPEIQCDHRIFPYPNESKVGYIPQGITANDYLLDDYNVNLREFEEAGGNSIKCLNHVNGKGLGAFGGDVGNHWLGAFLRHDDIPIKIAEILKFHIGDYLYSSENPLRETKKEVERGVIPKSQDLENNGFGAAVQAVYDFIEKLSEPECKLQPDKTTTPSIDNEPEM